MRVYVMKRIGTLSILSNSKISRLHVGGGPDAIAYHAGIYRPCWHGAYEDEDKDDDNVDVVNDDDNDMQVISIMVDNTKLIAKAVCSWWLHTNL